MLLSYYFLHFKYNYSEENGTISYKYNYLVILDENIYKLPEEFNSETEAEKLLKDKISYKIDGFISKSEKIFSSYLVLNDDRISFKFE